jgi:hypothetical protein
LGLQLLCRELPPRCLLRTRLCARHGLADHAGHAGPDADSRAADACGDSGRTDESTANRRTERRTANAYLAACRVA